MNNQIHPLGSPSGVVFYKDFGEITAYDAVACAAAYRASGMDEWAIKSCLASPQSIRVSCNFIEQYQLGILLGTFPAYISSIVSYYLVGGYIANENLASLDYYKKHSVQGMFLVSDYQIGYYSKGHDNYPIFRFIDEAIDTIT